MIRLLLCLLLPLANAVALAAEDFPAAPDQIRPLLLGSTMPDVPLQTLDGEATTLSAQVAGEPVILVFYRGGWCPYCNLQLSDLRLIADQAKALGYRIIAISPDRAEALGKTLADQKLDYGLLSDSSGAAMRAFGIGFRLDDTTYEKYKGYGIDLEEASGQTHRALPVPSVFIVDAAGVLQFAYVHPDYTLRVPGSVILAAAKSIAEREQDLRPRR